MQRQKTGVGLIVAVAVSLGLFVTGAQAQSGNLEPPPSAVDGAGDPAATTQTQPSWDQILDATNGDASGCNSTRFKCVMGGEAVLDNETGLVWQRSPDSAPRTWNLVTAATTARRHCLGQTTGARLGWRLPSVVELMSLVSAVDPVRPILTPGHPFIGIPVANSFYWTATTNADTTLAPTAWGVTFGAGGGGPSNAGKGSQFPAWCVRGGMNAAAY